MLTPKVKFQELKANDGWMVSIPYYKLQYVLEYETPIAYYANRYGWRCDVYDIDGVYICTGYEPRGKLKLDVKRLDSYEKKAIKLIAKYRTGEIKKLETLKKKLHKLAFELTREALARGEER